MDKPISRLQGQAFLAELRDLCQKRGVSISHEDAQGGFELKEYDEDLMRWLMRADYGEYDS